MKIFIPLAQPGGVFMREYIGEVEKTDIVGMYGFIMDTPRKTLKGAINYFNKIHPLGSFAEENE